MKTIIRRILTGYSVLMLMTTGVIAVPDEPGAMSASMDADGSRFTVTAPGVMAFLAGFSATILIDGQPRVLSSVSGRAHTVTNGLSEATPYGDAGITATTFYFHEENIELLFRLGTVPGVQGVMARAGIRNAGTNVVRLLTLTPVSLAGQLVGGPLEWRITALNKGHSHGAETAAVVALNEIVAPVSVHEYGGIYRKDGAGVFFGPVGAPTAYVDARFAPSRDGKVLLNLRSDMSGAIVNPGETRWGQQVVMLLEPPRVALARWTEWVAKTHGARTFRGALSGWNDRNVLKKDDGGKELRDVANAIRAAGGRLRLDVIQIEDSSGQLLSAPWLPACVQLISETGVRPGLRLEFGRNTNAVDAPLPVDIALITRTVQRAVQSGFTYLNICYPPSSASTPVDGETRTAFEIYRDDWEAIRRVAGEETYLLFCDKAPDRAVVGIVDASRIGIDTEPGNLRAAIQDVLSSYHFQGRWFTVDNDLRYMGTQMTNSSVVAGGSPMLRTWLSLVGLSCGAAITSDPGWLGDSKSYWRNFEVMTPPAKERTEVLDMCITQHWSRLVGQVKRDWGGWTVALLWNPGTTENSVRLDFAEAGLDPGRNYAVWSFWDNRYLGVANGSWTTPPLPPSGSQHLRFTDLDRAPDRPVVIGSSLHIYCGAVEIKRVTSLTDAIQIELTDAGARDGDLFVYSRQKPVLKEVTGCIVKDIVGAGENVWQISLVNRQRGAQQRVELGILLPFTRQLWFWLLIGAACSSLLFAAWRYVAVLRLQRERALAEERTRIARDLHDDLGGELASIAMLSDLTQHHAKDETVRARLREMSIHARDTVRRLEEIVWAINPANDNIEQFAGYFCKVAQAYLEVAGVRSRFDLPDQFPPRPLTSLQRHNLFLAGKEALHNAVRHGRPAEVTIRIALHGESLVVVVEDNGVGFNAVTPTPAGHGSANMQARMKGVGGTFERRSTPGQGTVVTLTAPLRA